MNIVIRRTTIDEVEGILEIQKESFQEDLEKYEDYESSPATEKLEKLAYKIENFIHYTILLDSEVVGGIDIRVLPDNHIRLNRIFLVPKCQNRGFGSKIIKMIEDKFPTAEKWSLDTPFKSYRNHHFYEKLGYVKVGEHRITDKLVLFDYEKRVTRSQEVT